MTGYDQAPVTSLKESARRGSRWSFLQFGGSRLATFLVFLVLARLLNPEDFGVIALATVFVALVQIVVEGGFGQALIQRVHLERGHVDTVFWTSVLTGLGLAGGLALAADPLAMLFHEPRLGQVLPALAIGLFIGALGSTHAAQLRRDLRFAPLAVRGLVSNAVAAVVAIVLAAVGAGVWALVAQYVVLNIVQTVLLWVTATVFPGLCVSWRHFLDIFAFSRNTLGTSLLQAGNRRLGELLIGALLGAVPLGLYVVGHRLLLVVGEAITQSLLGVAFPVFARLQNEPARLRKAYLLSLRASLALAMPVFLFFTIAATEAVQVLFGPQWLLAASVMAVLALAGIVRPLLAVSDSCLKAIGRPDIVFRNKILNMIVQLGAVAAVAPFGIVWVAWAVVAGTYLLAPLPVWSLIRTGVVDLRSCLRSFVAPLLAAAIMLGAVVGVRAWLLTSTGPILRLAAMLAVAIVAYVVALALLDRELFREIVQTTLPGRQRRQRSALNPSPHRDRRATGTQPGEQVGEKRRHTTATGLEIAS